MKACVSHQAWALDQVFVLGLSCDAVLKNLVTPYLLLTPGQFGWQRGASVTVLNNGILSLENLMQASLSPFPTAGVSFRQQVRQLFVHYCNLRTSPYRWSKALRQRSCFASRRAWRYRRFSEMPSPLLFTLQVNPREPPFS